MTSTDKISSKEYKILTLCTVFCIYLNIASFAQGERERNPQDFPKHSDAIGQYDSPDASSYENRTESLYRQNSSQNKDVVEKPVTSTTKKENPLFKQGGEKDAKKEGISTLSFNLFLYIVDKFKED
ncbi:hypothetical protein [Shivajiella indica]|uniref:Uncharacterized protein n=1 Tax=Shivajiella indica TaxID=872115 RepID=A0ABW5B6U7_9BACT